MDFDFYQQYKAYSNIDLLKIVKRPTEFQPEAIAIATRILNDRQLSAEEIQFVDEYFQGIDSSVNAKRAKVEQLKSKAADFLEPVIRPGEKVEPDKWVNILLLVIALQYAWTVFNVIKRLIIDWQRRYFRLDVTVDLDLFTLLYVPVIFILLFKRRRWGWILLFADNLFSVISEVGQSYYFFKYQNIDHGDTVSFFLHILIRGAFVFFLWREPIASHFGVTDKTKRRTALIVTGGTLLFILILYLMI